jgi:hypothetical protein
MLTCPRCTELQANDQIVCEHCGAHLTLVSPPRRYAARKIPEPPPAPEPKPVVLPPPRWQPPSPWSEEWDPHWLDELPTDERELWAEVVRAAGPRQPAPKERPGAWIPLGHIAYELIPEPDSGPVMRPTWLGGLKR